LAREINSGWGGRKGPGLLGKGLIGDFGQKGFHLALFNLRGGRF